ncbi:MAG: TolC family protein [Desulfofustis sp.]
METALLENLGLRLTQEDVTQAEGAALAAEGTFDIQLSADVGAGQKSETPVTQIAVGEEKTASWNAGVQKRFTPGTEMKLRWNNGNLDTDSELYLFDPAYSSEVTVELRQPLLRGLGKKAQLADLNSARTQVRAASFVVDGRAADLASEVKNAYWELVFAHQNLEVLELSLALARKLKEDTELRIGAGKLAAIDIFQPEAEVAQREQDLISGERQIGFAEDSLKLLLNSEKWLIPFDPVDSPPTDPIRPEIKKIYERALSNRPDLQAAALQVKASQYQLEKAENNKKPSLDLLGTVGLGANAEDYAQALDDSVSDSDTRWQIGLSISRPLDNSLAEGQYRQARATLNKNRYRVEQLKQEIRRTVRVTVRDVELAIRAIEATRKTLIATRKRLEAEQVKFEAGRSTTLDVLIAQQDYAQALSTENRTKIVYAQSLAELDRIQGIIRIP